MHSQKRTFKLRHIDVDGGWDRLDRWWVGKTRQHPTERLDSTLLLVFVPPSPCLGARVHINCLTHQLCVLACISIMDLAARARAGGGL